MNSLSSNLVSTNSAAQTDLANSLQELSLGSATSQAPSLKPDSTKKVTPSYNILSRDLKNQIARLLDPLSMQRFLRVSRECLQVGDTMLQGHDRAVSAILEEYGSISRIPQPLQRKVIAAAASIKALYLRKTDRGCRVDIAENFINLEVLNWPVEVGPRPLPSPILALCKLQELRTLNLSGYKALPHDSEFYVDLKKLEVLVLNNTRADNDDLQGISQVFNLQVLHLAGPNTCTAQGYACLSVLKNLRVLNLSESPIDDRGLLELVKARDLTSLRLNSCRRLTADGITKFWQHLTQRDLSLKEISENGVHKSLKEIDLSETNADHALCLKYAKFLEALEWLSLPPTRRWLVERAPLCNLQEFIPAAKIDDMFKLRLRLMLNHLGASIITTQKGFDELLQSLRCGARDQDRQIISRLTDNFANKFNDVNLKEFTSKLSEALELISKIDFKGLRPRPLHDTLKALATSGLHHWGLIRDVFERSQLRKLCDLSADEIAKICLVHGTLGSADIQLFALIADEIETRDLSDLKDLRDFSHQRLAIIIWAYAKLGIEANMLFGRIAQELEKRDLRTFTSQEIANILHAYAIDFHYLPLFTAFAHEIEKRNLRDFSLQEIATILHAYATVGVGAANQHLFRHFSREIERRDLRDVQPFVIDTIRASYEKLGFQAIMPRF